MRRSGSAATANLHHAEMEMGVQHGVLELGALAAKPRRHVAPGNPAKGIDEGIDRIEAHQMREAMVGNAGALRQKVGGMGKASRR